MYIFKTYLVFLAIMFCWVAVFLIKNDITYKHRLKIIMAIRNYHLKCVEYGAYEFVDYTDMEDYDTTLKRWWDWTNKRILPEDKFEIIKPFIE